MNWFRVPLNIIICLVLYWLHRDDGKLDSAGHTTNSKDYLVTAFLLNSAMCTIGLVASISSEKPTQKK